MIVGKWNYEKDDYEPYKIPDDWHTPMYSDDMDEIVNCASCGCQIKFGETYTSKVIHGRLGFGFPVCEDCYIAEWEEIDRRYWKG